MNFHIATGFLNFTKTLSNKDTFLGSANTPPNLYPSSLRKYFNSCEGEIKFKRTVPLHVSEIA
jgi:hypothetical protein